MDYILWETSYANLNMLLATIPVYDDEKTSKKTEGKHVESIAELKDFLNL